MQMSLDGADGAVKVRCGFLLRLTPNDPVYYDLALSHRQREKAVPGSIAEIVVVPTFSWFVVGALVYREPLEDSTIPPP